MRPTECVNCKVPLVFDHEIEPEIAHRSLNTLP